MSRTLSRALLSVTLFVSCSGPFDRVAGDRFRSDTLKMDFRYVPAGSFVMGSPPHEVGRDADETSRGVVLTRGFWLGETEVTQAQWRRLMETEPSFLAACGDDCPVERVSWFDAVAFANRASGADGHKTCYELVGCSGSPGSGCPPEEDWCHGEFVCSEVRLRGLDCRGYRLPTEAEWEYAARAGTEEATWIGDVSITGMNAAPELSRIAWYGGNSGVDYRPAWPCSHWAEPELRADECGTHPVATREPNPWGLADMLGNVWEWTWDWKGVPAGASVTDPLGPATGEFKIRRGCSWSNIPHHCRAADRSDDAPGDRDRNWGLRLARTAG